MIAWTKHGSGSEILYRGTAYVRQHVASDHNPDGSQQLLINKALQICVIYVDTQQVKTHHAEHYQIPNAAQLGTSIFLVKLRVLHQ